MPALRLLEDIRRCSAARDPAALAALFATDGELSFHGPPSSRAIGPAEIERLLRARWPDDALVIGEPARQRGGAVAATWGWRPDLVAGELRLAPVGDHIARLDVYALDVPVAPRARTSVRAAIVAPGPLILLFRCGEPGKGDTWWITPGGGHDPGEDDLQALRRELQEEVGIPVEALGACLWTRTHTFVWRQDVLCQHERTYLVRVAAAVEPAPTLVDDGTLGHRWWTLAELDTTDEILVPRRIAALIRAVLADGPPPRPFDAGV